MFRQEDYAKASVTELLQKLQNGETCAAALTEFALAIIAEREPALNAITWLYADEARQAAIASDEKRRRGHPCGRLEGIPLLVKDNIDVAGWPTTAGSKALLGIIALAGIIIRNAVIMISEVDANARAGLAAGEAIRQAAHHRARPILLTACAAILGMLPLAQQGFWGPMALAIIGGLVSGTLVTLTVLPAALSLLMQRRSR